MSDAAAGRAAIDVARRSMPALAAAADVALASGALRGRRVGIALMLEPKTACLAEALGDVGAEVVVFGNHFSTKPAVVAALRASGGRVFADRDEFLDTRIEYLADDGAGMTRRIHVERRDVLADLRGVAEETTSGVRPLRNMAAEGALAVPCIAVNDARSKVRFDNVYGTGHSVVMAVLDATGVHLAGSRVVVAGYGRVGHGIAAVAHGLGARVTVTEIDPVEALAAHHDGHDVAPLLDAVAAADVVITASGIGHTLTAEHLAVMSEGTIVAVGGAGWPEVDVGDTVSVGPEIAPHVRTVTTPSGTTVLLVAEGHCANTTAGEGNPIEIMDLSLALQLRALDLLAATSLPPGVHALPAAVDDEVAASQLAAAGIGIDVPSAAQRRAAAAW